MKGQRGSVIQKGSSYFIKYRDPTGKQKMEGSSPGHGFRTHDEAQARLHEVLDEVNKGTYVEKKPIKFAAFAEQWIGDRISIRGSTASAYGSLIRKHLTPNLGHMRVHEIQLATIQGLVSKLGKKLSVKSLHNALTLLRGMLVGKQGPSAIKLGYIRHDPTAGLELPQKSLGEVHPPTPEQVWELVETAKTMWRENKCPRLAHDIILIDAFTGLRRGEILALRYGDVDWFAGEITISRSITKVKAQDGVHKWNWKIGPTKNGKMRRVGVGKRVLAVFAELKQAATDAEGFIFTSTSAGQSGSVYRFVAPDFFNASIYAPVAAAAKLQTVRFHDLRHFYASMLIEQGESAKYVCDQLGHSSIQITFDTYGHLFPQSRREASKKLEEAMYAKKKGLVENLVETSPKEPPQGGKTRRAN
jgi:integrase